MSINEIQDELIEDFDLFEAWDEKYSYIIELGKKLGGVPDAEKVQENIIKGCQSNVWLVASKNEDGEVIHKGISKRYFKRSFTIADDVEVKGAELKDGLLKVSMEKIIPDAKKLKTIDIK